MSYAEATGSSRTITAFFDSRSEADEAVASLIAAGLNRESVRVVAGAEGGQIGTVGSDKETGFWDTLKDMFVPDEDRYSYAEGLRRGGYLVTVKASDANYDTALDILDDEGTIDIAERESTWRSEGWQGYSDASSVGTSAGIGAKQATGEVGSAYSDREMAISESQVGESEVIPVAEEELRIGKRDVSHGRVRVRSYVVETPVSEQVSLREESVHIQRRPVDRALTGEEQLFQDRTIELEERAEEAVVSKEARVKEEIVINKDVESRTETVTDTIRRTEVEVEDERVRTGESGLKRPL